MKTQVISLESLNVLEKFAINYGIKDLLPVPGLTGIEVREIPATILNVLKETDISYSTRTDSHSLFIYGTPDLLSKKIEMFTQISSEAATDMLASLKKINEYNSISYVIGTKTFSFSQAYLMGILNVTPDSFSDGGKYYDKAEAIKHAVEMLSIGADIIDIGGESTRPGSSKIDEKEELRRVIPVIEEIIKLNSNAVISIDTTKSSVAREAVKAGASIINDISGLVFDKKIAEVAAEYNTALVIMHMKGTPADMQKNPTYTDVVSEVYDFLYDQTLTAERLGVKKIIIDPGIGFGKTIEHNFELISRLEDFKSLGYPILAGLSRKSFIGKYLELGIEERDSASAVADSIALTKGARIIRTHNIKNGMYVKQLFNRLN